MKILIDKIYALFTGKETPTEQDMVDMDVCPNCWGKQEYDNEVREVVIDRNKTEHEQKAFIAKFIERHLTGITLRHQDDKLVCPCCDGVYKNSPTNAN